MYITKPPPHIHCMCDILCACTLVLVSYLGIACAQTPCTSTKEFVHTHPFSAPLTRENVRATPSSSRYTTEFVCKNDLLHKFCGVPSGIPMREGGGGRGAQVRAQLPSKCKGNDCD